jgi:hypothetical protein
LTSSKPWSKQEYYQAYRKSFEQGEYNKEERVATKDGITIRRYFSGGISPMAITQGLTAINSDKKLDGGIRFSLATQTVGDINRETGFVPGERVAVQTKDGGMSVAQAQALRDEMLKLFETHDMYMMDFAFMKEMFGSVPMGFQATLSYDGKAISLNNLVSKIYDVVERVQDEDVFNRLPLETEIGQGDILVRGNLQNSNSANMLVGVPGSISSDALREGQYRSMNKFIAALEQGAKENAAQSKDGGKKELSAALDGAQARIDYDKAVKIAGDPLAYSLDDVYWAVGYWKQYSARDKNKAVTHLNNIATTVVARLSDYNFLFVIHAVEALLAIDAQKDAANVYLLLYKTVVRSSYYSNFNKVLATRTIGINCFVKNDVTDAGPLLWEVFTRKVGDNWKQALDAIFKITGGWDYVTQLADNDQIGEKDIPYVRDAIKNYKDGGTENSEKHQKQLNRIFSLLERRDKKNLLNKVNELERMETETDCRNVLWTIERLDDAQKEQAYVRYLDRLLKVTELKMNKLASDREKGVINQEEQKHEVDVMYDLYRYYFKSAMWPLKGSNSVKVHRVLFAVGILSRKGGRFTDDIDEIKSKAFEVLLSSEGGAKFLARKMTDRFWGFMPAEISESDLSFVAGALKRVQQREETEAAKDGGQRTVGGIDFRTMPMNNVPVFHSLVLIPVHPVSLAEIDGQWQNIRGQINAGTVPVEELKTYTAACKSNKEAVARLRNVEEYVNTVLRLEEDAAVSTSSQMKEILAIVG